MARHKSSEARKPWWRRWFGERSERAAARYLKGLGYRIVARHYACPAGELDIVALDGDCIVFVEVRSTQSNDPGGPAASVDAAKQRRLTTLGLQFLKTHDLLNQRARFDVLALSWPIGERHPRVEHFRAAFEASGRFQFHS